MDEKSLIKIMIISVLIILSLSIFGLTNILKIINKQEIIANKVVVEKIKPIEEIEIKLEEKAEIIPFEIIEEVEEPEKIPEKIIKAPLTTNILILGLDNSSLLSDVILVANFDSEDNKMKITSIPRDTLVSLCKEDVNEIKKIGSKYIPKSGQVKFNEINSYAGKKNGPRFIKKYLKSMMDIDIDYYAIIDLEAFTKIVNDVGGIYVDIPKGGLYYKDKYQDLNIAIPEGRQLLDGENAEGLVRYRKTYVDGDLGRIEMQKTFMKEFFNQVMNKEVIKNNFFNFASTALNYVETDFGITDLPQYLECIKTIGECSIEFETIRGEPKYINGGWYFIYNEKGD